MDVFETERMANPPGISLPDKRQVPCVFGGLPDPLPLVEAVERILCHEPAVRQAWAQAIAQAAQVGIKRSAYLPRLDGQLGAGVGYSDVERSGGRGSNSGARRTRNGDMTLSWILFDFGRREASLSGAQQLLLAANAHQQAVLQDTFFQAVQIYYQAQAGRRRLTASEQVLALARKNFEAADAKYKAGTVALSDQLQAQTALSRANLRQVRERGELEKLLGTMALRMGLTPNKSLRIENGSSTLPDTTFITSVDELLAIARDEHPALIAAQARVRAAEASVEESRAYGRPSIALTANIRQAQNGQSTALGSDIRQNDRSIGLQLSIPLFHGFERTYQVRDAQARVTAGMADLADARQRVSLDVWTYYQVLRTETQSLLRTAEIEDQSRQALMVIRGRYQSGVGSMTELLNAMSAFVDAQELHIDALNGWQIARLGLASSLGRLGFWTVE
ncbi:TolC family protein [Pseudomonas chlororaphis]|uniref:TolC family protein n=1 Tax=Pseudomonas chlororaphis TaxID=587753 RepID=UPI001CB941A3|nr:TolC family protein [Pseudomonas chlororaphis]